MASRLVALKEGAIAAAGAADVGLIIALGRGKATDNPLARLRTSTQSTTAIRKYRPFPDGWAKESKSASRQLDRRFNLSWRLQQSLVDRRTPTQSSVWSGFAEPRWQLGTTLIRSGVKFVGAHGLPQINNLRGRSLLVRNSIARLSDASCGAFEIAIA